MICVVGSEMSEVGPGLDMEVLGAIEDPHVDYQELEQYLHQYHPGPAHYPEYPQGVYHELQPSKPPYQPSQVNINVSLINRQLGFSQLLH